MRYFNHLHQQSGHIAELRDTNQGKLKVIHKTQNQSIVLLESRMVDPASCCIPVSGPKIANFLACVFEPLCFFKATLHTQRDKGNVANLMSPESPNIPEKTHPFHCTSWLTGPHTPHTWSCGKYFYICNPMRYASVQIKMHPCLCLSICVPRIGGTRKPQKWSVSHVDIMHAPVFINKCLCAYAISPLHALPCILHLRMRELKFHCKHANNETSRMITSDHAVPLQVATSARHPAETVGRRYSSPEARPQHGSPRSPLLGSRSRPKCAPGLDLPAGLSGHFAGTVTATVHHGSPRIKIRGMWETCLSTCLILSVESVASS